MFQKTKNAVVLSATYFELAVLFVGLALAGGTIAAMLARPIMDAARAHPGGDIGAVLTFVAYAGSIGLLIALGLIAPVIALRQFVHVKPMEDKTNG
jgi:hypothetical protein